MRLESYHIVLLVVILCCVAFVSGCSRRVVEITSNPSGAVVTYNCRYIGETPLYYTVESKTGFNNKYKFCAILQGYEPGSVEFVEDEWAFDIDWVVPEKIHFDLKPIHKR